MRIKTNRWDKVLIALALVFCTSAYSDNLTILSDDRLEIQQLLHNYAYAWDSKDVGRFVSLFTDDAEVQSYSAGELKSVSATLEQRTQRAVAAATTFTAGGIQTRHYMANTILTRQPDNTIKGETYFYVMWQYDNEPAPIPMHTGIYVDIFAKTSNGWKFAKREIRVDHI